MTVLDFFFFNLQSMNHYTKMENADYDLDHNFVSTEPTKSLLRFKWYKFTFYATIEWTN